MTVDPKQLGGPEHVARTLGNMEANSGYVPGHRRALRVAFGRHFTASPDIAALTVAGHLQEPQVRAMFDPIVGFDDVMNSVMTAGLHHTWRHRAADLAQTEPGDRVLDVATGAGDLALGLAGRVGPSGEVIGSDFCEEMLTRARSKPRPRLRSGHLRVGERHGPPPRPRAAVTRAPTGGSRRRRLPVAVGVRSTRGSGQRVPSG